MDLADVKDHCSRLPGATSKSYGPPSNILVYYARGRKFAYFKTSEPERWRFSIRVAPECFLALIDVPGIKPARYLARFHWITIVDVSTVAPAYLQELIAWSYTKAVTRTKRTARRRNETPPFQADAAARHDIIELDRTNPANGLKHELLPAYPYRRCPRIPVHRHRPCQ